MPLHVTASAAISLDGHLDDRSPERLVLSSAADLADVHALRARCDAILVGAGTVRADDPSLTVRRDLLAQFGYDDAPDARPARIAVTASGRLDPDARIFAGDGAVRLVYCPEPAANDVTAALGGVAEIAALPAPLTAAALVDDLEARGFSSLLVEGGQAIHTLFLAEGAVDSLRLAVAPLFVGDPSAPRLVGAGPFPHGPARRAELVAADRFGDTAVLRYRLARS